MKYFLLICMFIFSSPLFCETAPTSEDKDLPRTFQVWESEHADREAKEEGRYGELWNKTLLILAVLILFLFGASWFMKRFDRFKVKPQDTPNRILLVERKVLSPKSVLYLIEIDGDTIALAESATNGVQVLHSLYASKLQQKTPSLE